MTTKTLLAATLLLTAIAGCDQGGTGTTVGRKGGIVTSDDGRLTLEIPAGALHHDVDIVIVETDAPYGAIGTAYTIEPVGTQLVRPATLTYDVASDDADRSLDLASAGVAVEDLALVTDKADRWMPMHDRRVDADDELVSASVLYLSSYALVAH